MIEYWRDLPAGASAEVVAAEEAHVRVQVAAMADADDDPTTHAESVDIVTVRLDDGQMRIKGFLDADPDAPYLQPGHDHLAGVDLELLAQFPGAMGLDRG